MPTIEARGYVKFPEAKTSGGGKTYSKFKLGVKQKDKAYGDVPEKVTYANFQVSDFNNSSPPEEGAYVTVTGFLKVREVEKDGSTRTYLDIVAQSVEVAPPLDGGGSAPAAAPKAAKKAAKKPEKDPWD
jgi:hypothetical protein